MLELDSWWDFSMKLLHRLWSSSKQASFVLSLSFSMLWWAVDSSTNDNDVIALRALKESWELRATLLLQWDGDDPCGSNWTGLGCDKSYPQRVTSLRLPGLGLDGSLPSDISLLSALLTLDLSSNSLSGYIPTQIGLLARLDVLYLQFNNLSGPIPKEIGQLKNLNKLSLTGNSLSGEIPNEIGLLANLVLLDLAQNKLRGSLPFSADGSSIVPAGLDNLTKAQHFHLNNNSFSGPIPDSMCHSSMSLIHLLLDSNCLSGTIPGSLGSCSKLLIVKLNNNLLRGTIPDQFGQLTSLTELQLGLNELVGPLPDLSNLTKLGVIDLSDNPLNMEFPMWMSSLPDLTDLSMQGSHVGGSIPPSFFRVKNLTNVKLANNSINGTLDFSSATSPLMLVSIENNDIEGVKFRNRDINLRLQGNPVCTGPTHGLPEMVCSDSSSASATPQICTGFQENPLQSASAVPYQGQLLYRAPSFISLTNASRLSPIVAELEGKLSVDQSQVQISDACLDDLNELTVVISIFPSGSGACWSLNNVLRMAFLLSIDAVSPPGFGPASFRAFPYDNPACSADGGSGLSIAAKIGIGAALSGLVIIAVGCFACLQKRRADKAVELSKRFGPWGRASGKDRSGAPQLKGARYFSFSELKKATNNFSERNKIGSGGHGKVYRGILSSGEQVAVKRAQGSSMQGAMEFKAEIELLSLVHHKNIVRLVGFCFEQGEQMLVYEHMASGSLRDCLAGRSGVKLDWRQRIMVALGTARGIMYLHELVNPPIIHRDIKSANVLLDGKKSAKVADIGLPKTGRGEKGYGKQHVSTQVENSLGYLDPEYYIYQQLTVKSDVYSYGVVLLELLTSRVPIEHGKKHIVKEVKKAIDQGAWRSMLDPRLQDEELSEMNAFVRIALSCVEDSAASRPSMREVVKQLEKQVGQDYLGSGSSIIEVENRQAARRYSYGSDSGYSHTSRGSSHPSFRSMTSPFDPR